MRGVLSLCGSVALAGMLLCSSPRADGIQERIESHPPESKAVQARVSSGLPEEERAPLFARFVIESLINNTPKTLHQRLFMFYEVCDKPLLLQVFETDDESLQEDMKLSIESKVKSAEQGDTVTYWVPGSGELPVTVKQGDVYKVSEKGHVGRMGMGMTPNGMPGETPVTIEMTFKAAPETGSNPYGFIVTSYNVKLDFAAQKAEQ